MTKEATGHRVSVPFVRILIKGHKWKKRKNARFRQRPLRKETHMIEEALKCERSRQERRMESHYIRFSSKAMMDL